MSGIRASWLITALVCIGTSGVFAADREIEIEGKYLNFPVTHGADKWLISLNVDGERVREFTLELASGEPDYWVYLEVQDFIGKTGSLNVRQWKEKKEDERGEKDAKQVQGLEAVHCADTFPGAEDLYKEELRPQFHFSVNGGLEVKRVAA